MRKNSTSSDKPPGYSAPLQPRIINPDSRRGAYFPGINHYPVIFEPIVSLCFTNDRTQDFTFAKMSA